MKYGQVTMCGDNYGACLQALALQLVVMDLGGEIELIRYVDKPNGRDTSHLYRLKRIGEVGLRGTFRYIREHKYIVARKRAFQGFRERHILFSSHVYYRDENLDTLNNEYDAFICGSDMIWSEEFSEDWDFYYLGFADRVKSYTYGPSFGRNAFDAKLIERVRDYLQCLNSVSCREAGGVDFIRRITSIEATQVVDPTLLIGADGWNKYLGSSGRVVSDKYALAYVFGQDNKWRGHVFDAVRDAVGSLVFIPRNEKEMRKLGTVVDPIEFLIMFRDADYIVTDTFHGLMFALVFNKPFVVLSRDGAEHWAQYSDRITSVLGSLQLEERYLKLGQDWDRRQLEYNRSEVHEALARMREDSLEYLKKIVGR